MTTTAEGQISFWDLHTQQRLDQFVVHHNGVSQLRASQSGRYLLTAENGGIVRYWETYWTAGELRAKGNDLPWPSKRKAVGRFSQLLGGRG